ncbi:MAG: hypothetical protein CM1200mP9_01680 [Gammaproteobacteria bacterium]|nr:MAG: hypothetical protein CM1200mP9_01680 [Gammaproteobacteria bacterium]
MAGQVVAVYQLTQMTETEFALVSIRVEAGYRRRGLGTWMLGHAIGLAEARGGRSIEVVFAQGHRFFERSGFNPRKKRGASIGGPARVDFGDGPKRC